MAAVGHLLVRLTFFGPADGALAVARQVVPQDLDEVRANVPPQYGGPRSGMYTPTTMDPARPPA